MNITRLGYLLIVYTYSNVGKENSYFCVDALIVDDFVKIVTSWVVDLDEFCPFIRLIRF